MFREIVHEPVVLDGADPVRDTRYPERLNGLPDALRPQRLASVRAKPKSGISGSAVHVGEGSGRTGVLGAMQVDADNA